MEYFTKEDLIARFKQIKDMGWIPGGDMEMREVSETLWRIYSE